MLEVNNSNTKKKEHIRVVCISDTHSKIDFDIPHGDILSKVLLTLEDCALYF